MKRIVLAYSGSVTTSAAIPWVMERHGAEVVTVTLDVGQGLELAHIRERALAAGAVRAHVIDARDEFVRRHVLPSFRAGAFADLSAFSTTAQTRPLIARRLLDLAKMEAASAVAHGSGCDDPDRVLLEAAIHAIDPSVEILAPTCEWGMSPEQVVEYARARGIPAAAGHAGEVDVNLLGRTFYGATNSHHYKLTRSVADAPNGAALIELEFLHGTPIRTNGVDMPMIEIIESIETIAGAHGVGRVNLEPDVVAESPAAVVLHAAYDHLARVAPELSGTVKLKLSKGHCEVIGSRTSEDAAVEKAAF